MEALQDLRKDGCCNVLTAHKGVTLVVMDKAMYIEKCLALLKDKEVYKECRDQTRAIHSKVVKQLLDLKIQLELDSRNNTTDSPSARFYGPPKYIKATSPSGVKY